MFSLVTGTIMVVVAIYFLLLIEIDVPSAPMGIRIGLFFAAALGGYMAGCGITEIMRVGLG